MSRVKRGVTAHARHKKVLNLSKGFRGRSSTCYRSALERLEKAMQYAYRDRRNRRRDLRELWIVRINAAAREHGLKYSQFIYGLSKANISLDRKILSELVINDKLAFAEIANKVKAVLA
ncbi:50S ribosomal protein L20 [Alphaproteobacteria bacterium]|nr:50S ribosomal protein L20 [Alphaproteobacteria bacterium]